MEQFFTQNELIFLLVIIWTLIWKGIALWRAARNTNKRWFVFLLALNTLGILPIVYIFIFGKKDRVLFKKQQTKEQPIKEQSKETNKDSV